MKTVLIVDDNIKNLDLFKDFVESWGYETVTAQQGKDAISLAERYLQGIKRKYKNAAYPRGNDYCS